MAKQFCIQVPWDLWERFEARATQEHDSTRQAALALLREYVDRPPRPPKGETDHAPTE
jgi:hypothetical protein